MIVDSILLGGGEGKRFNSSFPKQFLELSSKPVFVHTIEAVRKIYPFRKIIVVVPENWFDLATNFFLKYFSKIKEQFEIIVGGNSRLESAKSGINAINKLTPPQRLFVHDMCRCYLSESFIGRIREKLLDTSFVGWVPVIPVTDTLKILKDNKVYKTVDRSNMVRVQTPQIFDYSVYSEIFKISSDFSGFTDDASIFEYFGYQIGVFDGEYTNIKLTYPSELDILELLLKTNSRKCELESDMIFTV